MRTDAVIAVVIATICMLLYIWFRFKDIRFATSAVLALIHDVLVVLAVYAIGRVSSRQYLYRMYADNRRIFHQCNNRYFDRIREELKTQRKDDLALLVKPV